MVEKNTVRRAYDDLGGEYVAQRDHDGRGLAVLETFLDAATPGRVLDAGSTGSTNRRRPSGWTSLASSCAERPSTSPARPSSKGI